MVYGELGATPLSLISQSRMVMSWARIKQVEENPKISSLLFQILLKMYKNGNLKTYWKGLQLYVQKVLCSEGTMFRRFYVQKVLCSEGPMFRRFYVQKVLYSKGSMIIRSYVQKYLFRRSYVQKVRVTICQFQLGTQRLKQRQ